MDTPAKKLYVSYTRVSTDKQQASGLGLEAQIEKVHQFCRDGELIGEFTEAESGRNSERPELVKAMLLARKNRATLVIAKLDRLSRNVHFISGLMESGVEFVAVDNPYANRLTLHILAAVAEDEARRISERTKAALAVLKARGMPLGLARTSEALEKARANGLMVRADGRERSMNSADACIAKRTAARDAYLEKYSIRHLQDIKDDLGAMMDELIARRNRNHTYERLAKWLNKQGRKTLQGSRWTGKKVWRVFRMLQKSQNRNTSSHLEPV